jgi:Family of unknown function (DUF6236)
MPAFSTALYYPCTESPTDKWLKNAFLYWDKIRTIVPHGEKPYESETALTLHDNGLLEPLFVDSDMPEIVELSDQVLSYLDSPDAKKLLKPKKRTVRLAASKGSRRFFRRAASSNEDKLPSKIKQLVRKPPSSLDGWLEVDERFADFYLTLLATRLSENRGMELLADKRPFDQLALTAKLDSVPSRGPEGKKVPKQLAQGILANLAIERIAIDPETPIQKLLEFRQKHANELGTFRTKIGDLTKTIEGDLPLAALDQQVNDIYKNEYLPGYNAFTSALRGSGIKFLAESILRVSFFSIPVTSLAVMLAGMSAPNAVLLEVGAAVSLALCAVSYNVDRKNQINQSPYLYLLQAKKKLR